jgi:hypothetical protein
MQDKKFKNKLSSIGKPKIQKISSKFLLMKTKMKKLMIAIKIKLNSNKLLKSSVINLSSFKHNKQLMIIISNKKLSVKSKNQILSNLKC